MVLQSGGEFSVKVSARGSTTIVAPWSVQMGINENDRLNFDKVGGKLKGWNPSSSNPMTGLLAYRLYWGEHRRPYPDNSRGCWRRLV